MSAGTKPLDDKPPSAVPGDSIEPESEPSWKKMALVAAGVAILLTVVYLSPLGDYLGRTRGALSERVRSFGVLAPLVLTLGVAALVAVGFPGCCSASLREWRWAFGPGCSGLNSAH